jgi:hypothetical protein
VVSLGYGLMMLALAPPATGTGGQALQAEATPDLTPADPSQASGAGFDAVMVVTDDHDAFLRDWKTAAAPARLGTSRFTREKPVNIELLFSGCRFGMDARCKVNGQLWITGPEGSTRGPIPVAVWNRPPPGDHLQLSPNFVRIGFDASDSPGPYRIKAEVTDEVAGTTREVEQVLQLEAR